MLKFFSHSLRISLSHTSLNVTRKNNWPRAGSVVVANVRLPEDTVAHPERLGKVISSLLKQPNCSGTVARFILADELVRFFMVTPPQNPTTLQDVRAAAAMRFQSLYDEAAANWLISADWDAKQTFLACAVPHGLVTAIRQAGASHRVKIVEIAPEFVSAINRWKTKLVPEAWFGTVHENTLTLGVMHQRRLHAVRCMTMPTDAWKNDQCLPDLLTKEALRLDLPLPDKIQLCGNFPGHWAKKEFGALTCIRLAGSDYIFSEAAPAAGAALTIAEQLP